MPVEIAIAVMIVAAIVVSVPVRRLRLDGYSGGAVAAYVGLILLLALGVTEARTLGRVLLPILGLAYIAPFITFGGGIDRLLGRRRPVVSVTPVARPVIEPPRNVTPRDATPPAVTVPADETTEPASSDRPGPPA
jgi:hypothetical protein